MKLSKSDMLSNGVSLTYLPCVGSARVRISSPKLSIVIGLMLFCSLSIAAMERGKPPITFYDTPQFGFHNQNWGIKQHTNGLIYAANGKNLLVFDGTNWRGLLVDTQIDMSDFIFLHDRIYVGTANGRGYLETEPSGQWRYHSLTGLQSSIDSNVTIRVFAIEEYVVFLTSQNLWLLRPDGRFERVAEGDFVDMWQVNKYLLVESKTQGVNQFDPIANQWDQMVDVNQYLGGKELEAVVPLSDNDDWLLISGDAIYSYRQQTQTRLNTAALDWLRQNEVQASALLHNGDIALGGRSGGILIINTRGEAQRVINRTLGFNRQLITSMTVDHQGNLWLTHSDLGISKIEIGAVRTIFDGDLGINNAGDLARFNGRLFAASFFGLHALLPGSEENQVFKLVSKKSSNTLTFVVIGEELLFADSTGLQTLRFEKDKIQISRISHRQDIGSITKLGHPLDQGKRVYASTKLGVIRLQKRKDNLTGNSRAEQSNHWQVSKLNGFQAYTEFIESDSWGNLWVGSRDGNLYKISALELWPHARVERINELSMDNAGNVSVFEFNGDVIIATVQGVFRIEGGRPKPDKRFSKLHQQHGYIHRLHKASAEGAYWVCFTATQLGLLTMADHQLHFSPLELTSRQPVKALFDDRGQYLWVGHDWGVSRIELGNRIRAKKFAPRAGLIVDKDTQTRLNHHALEAWQSQPVLLSPGHHNLRLYLELPHYSSLDKVQVRSKLEGFQQRWSNWSGDAYVDYLGLGHGRYTWLLEAKYQDGSVLRSQAIDLTISPYWYEQTWFRVLGLICAMLLLFAAIYGLFYWRITVLKRRNRTLEIMVGERTKAITAKNAEITALHERKTRFFYYLSHEFRTPLALIMGAQEAILDAVQKPSSNWTGRLLKLAYTNSQRLNQLTNRLLDQQLAERGQLRLHVEQYSLEDFLQEVVASFSFESQQRQVTISLVRVEHLTLWFDREHMISIFYNIISNALKYSRDSGEIRISAIREQQSAKITIADNGIGIPKEVLNKVFDSYYRHQTAEQEARGHGLGLAFSKTLVELHGGCISLESDAAAGTRVSVCFPLGRDHFNPEHLKKSAEISPSGLEATSTCLAEGDSVAASLQRAATLLVVDDNYELCQFINLILQREFTIVVEHNGLKALNYCKQSPPDLIIADVMMPALNGIEMTQALKAHRPTAGIPIILLSALADKPSVVKGLAAGADDYLSKPFHIGELKLRIARLLYSDGYGSRGTQPPLPTGTDFKSAISIEINLNSADPGYSVDTMAKNLGLDRYNLYRYVKDYFDQSPTDLLLKTRLDKAKRLVESSRTAVNAIAYECGFNSVSYFNRSFKKQYQLTPTAWRKQRRDQAVDVGGSH